MGGRIEVASQHGHGSTFRFFIESRTARTHLKPSLGANESLDPPALSGKKRPASAGKRTLVGPKPHVLIVEDNLINQTVLMRQLRHVGLTCDGEFTCVTEPMARIRGLTHSRE